MNSANRGLLILIFVAIFCFCNSLRSNNLQIFLPKSSKVSAIPKKMIAGEVHYSRIPVQYWEHRIQMIKSMGFNALSVYIMWNYHEVSKGVFDYKTGNKNLPLFLQLAQKYQMKVLFRPGPYVCAEWDFGGFPARLLNVNGLKLRSNNQAYLEEVRIYFESLVPIILKYQDKNNGPIVLLQIQNEYGFYGKDKTYIQALRNMWHNLGVIMDEYYVDTASNLLVCHWSGANIGINDGKIQEDYTYARTIQKTGVIFGGQIYSGWLTHWGQSWQGKNLTQYMKQFTFLFSHNHSFSMYMVHGGSNFALTAGANSYDDVFDYRGHVTSYDYEAPIDEQGSPNQKFYAFKQLALKYVDWPVPDPPASIPTIQISPFQTKNIASIFANLPAPTITKSATPYLFESNELKMFNQGFVLYETTLAKKTHYITLTVHDYAIVYLDNKFLMNLDRSEHTIYNLTIACQLSSCKLSILVEAMGHINFDHAMEIDRKGLFAFKDTQETKFLWDIYKINVNAEILTWSKNNDNRAWPALSLGILNLNEVGDTFLDLSNFKKGYVWVNGVNLGRYWNKGPQSKLFCPGVWLRKGQNNIHVLELQTNQVGSIKGDKSLKSL